QFDFGLRFAGHALAIGDIFRQGRVLRRRRDAQVNAQPRSEVDQRVANVVAGAHVCELEATQSAEFLFQCKKIGKRLAGMKFVGKRVDHGDAGVRRHFLEDPLMVNASDYALDPELEVASDIGEGLPRAERGGRLRVVQENDGTTHALDADVEGDPRAERGLLENQRYEFAVERGGVTNRARFDVRRKLEQFTRVRRAPLRSGEEIIRQRNRSNESRGGHFFSPYRSKGNTLRIRGIAGIQSGGLLWSSCKNEFKEPEK